MVQPQHRRPWGNDTSHDETPTTPVTPSPSSQVPNSNQMVIAYEQPKLTLSRRLGYEVLTIVVGKEPRIEPFAVHKNMLRDLGGVFTQMCAESPSGTKVNLKNEDPEVFKLLIDYAYTEEIPHVSVWSNANEKAAQLRNLIQFYALADKFSLNLEVRNRTMDNIQDGFYIVGKLPEGPLVHAVYEHSDADSKLRNFCAATMAYHLHDENYVQDGVIPVLINSNEELMVDFLEAIRAYRHRQDPRIRHCKGNPLCVECDGSNHLEGKDGVHPCQFHIHDKFKNEDGEFVDDPCYLWKRG
ncbi:hypothetical protein BKA61DRAFT_677984 [Leptodontidium sp. MPI-SDFR-AT-0119]|nr:hypothetical protein BKA61DRAFT_677984 [Leptodontidium sp. MPI-SDFR-AT-0119]